MCRKLLFIFSCLICFASSSAQTSSAVSRLSSYIRVWGLLKYYHPAFGTGQYDPDSVFIRHLPAVQSATSKMGYGLLLDSLINDLGPVPAASHQKDNGPLLTKNSNSNWIIQDPNLTSQLRSRLLNLRNRGYTDSVHRYMPSSFFATDLPAEKRFDSIRYPDIPFQLLALARYWNAIEYLYPYKYMMSKNWYSVLQSRIPFFTKPMQVAAFEKQLLALNAAIEDTHGGILTIRDAARVYGTYYPPFAFRFAGDSIVVTDFIDSAACSRQDIRRGDVIIAINGKRINTVLKKYNDIVSASNEHKKKEFLSSLRLLMPLRGFDSALLVQVIRGKQKMDRKLHLQKPDAAFSKRLHQLFQQYNGNGSTTRNSFVLKSLTSDIAMVDAANLSILYNSSEDDHAIDSVLNRMRGHSKAIIIDLRCYATQAVFYNKLLPALGRKLQPFAVLQSHSISFPGMYASQDIFSAVPVFPLQSKYTGQVILLVNAETQSQSELITMILQASGPVLTVGEQTAGCDGDMLYLPIPGGYTTSFSGRHVAYPDGRASQKNGVKRDLKLQVTTSGLALGKDEILEAALRALEAGYR